MAPSINAKAVSGELKSVDILANPALGDQIKKKASQIYDLTTAEGMQKLCHTLGYAHISAEMELVRLDSLNRQQAQNITWAHLYLKIIKKCHDDKDWSNNVSGGRQSLLNLESHIKALSAMVVKKSLYIKTRENLNELFKRVKALQGMAEPVLEQQKRYGETFRADLRRILKLATAIKCIDTYWDLVHELRDQFSKDMGEIKNHTTLQFMVELTMSFKSGGEEDRIMDINECTLVDNIGEEEVISVKIRGDNGDKAVALTLQELVDSIKAKWRANEAARQAIAGESVSEKATAEVIEDADKEITGEIDVGEATTGLAAVKVSDDAAATHANTDEESEGEKTAPAVKDLDVLEEKGV